MSEVSTGAESTGGEISGGESDAIVPAGEGAGISEATASPEQKQAMQILKEKFKITVDGQDFEEELDWNNKEDIKRRLQMARAAEKRMAEAKTAKNQAFDIIKAFEADPASVLERLGPKGREVAEKFLLKQIQDDMMSPEEKEMRMTKLELAKYKEQEAKDKAEKETRAQSEVEFRYAQEYQNTIIQALEKSKLPKSPDLVKAMAGLMAKSLDQGLELSADDLVYEIKKARTSELRAIIADADGEQLIEMFGSDIANKIRKSDLKKLQEKQGQVFQAGRPSSQGGAPRGRDQKPKSLEQWKSELEERLKNEI